MRSTIRYSATLVLCGLASTVSARPAVPTPVSVDPRAPHGGETALGRRALDELARQAPALDPQVLSLASEALQCARRRHEVGNDGILGVIDYSLPSTERRLWVFDLNRRQLLFREWVAHGRGSGDNLAARFSNTEGSHMSSLGGFVARETYTGHNGYSLRLQGLEPGFNDQARDRAIVMHGASYVSESIIRSQGRLGRSLGCPAVRKDVARPLIDTLRDGAFLFAYYPDPRWLRDSPLLEAACTGGAVASVEGVAP